MQEFNEFFANIKEFLDQKTKVFVLIKNFFILKLNTFKYFLILKNIINNYKNKTIIFVTHRVDNIDLFDRVVKIDNKEILEDVTRNN